MADYSNNNVTKILYNGAAVDLGQEAIGSQSTSQMPIAVEINQPTDLGGAQGGGQALVGGDLSSDATLGSDTTCQLTDYTDNPTGSGDPITPQNPLVCIISAVASPGYPGLRAMTFQLYDDTGTLVASIPLNDTGLSPDALLFPMASSVPLSNFYAPSGVAVTGDNHIVYVADSGTDDPNTSYVYGWYAAENYEYTVNTGAYPLSFATGVAVNRNGDVYIADFELAEVIVVPASGAAPYKLDTGTLLKTPFTLAFNPQGDLIIGDNGPEGFYSSEAQPGFLVEVPHAGGPAFLLNTGPVTLAEPDALAFDAAGDLYVADAGPWNPDTQTYSPGQVVLVPHDGSTPSVVNVPGFVPAGISVDPAGDLDVMFAFPASITVVPPNGGTQYSLPFAPNSLTNVANLTAINGSQLLLVSDDDNGTLQQLNGITVPLSFPATAAGSQSDPLSVSMFNIGNQPLALNSPAFLPAGQSADFPLQGTTTCTDSLVVTQAGSCTVSAVFAPSTSGDFSATLTLWSNAYVGNDLLNNYNYPAINLSGSTSGEMGMVVRATPLSSIRPLQGRGRKHVRPVRPMSVN